MTGWAINRESSLSHLPTSPTRDSAGGHTCQSQPDTSGAWELPVDADGSRQLVRRSAHWNLGVGEDRSVKLLNLGRCSWDPKKYIRGRWWSSAISLHTPAAHVHGTRHTAHASTVSVWATDRYTDMKGRGREARGVRGIDNITCHISLSPVYSMCMALVDAPILVPLSPRPGLSETSLLPSPWLYVSPWQRRVPDLNGSTPVNCLCGRVVVGSGLECGSLCGRVIKPFVRDPKSLHDS